MWGVGGVQINVLWRHLYKGYFHHKLNNNRSLWWDFGVEGCRAGQLGSFVMNVNNL